MSTIRNPVGPQPPSVYWRRRLLVALGIAAIVVVIILLIVGRTSGTPGAVNTDKPGGGASTPASSTSAKPGAACDPSVIKLVPVTDASSYAADTQPQLSMSITNSGASACTFDVGTDAQVYVITSGSDQIWSSKDCQQDPVASKELLEPGKTVSTTPFAWDRTRSSPTTCTGSRPAVVAGGASYHLDVLLGEAKSKDDKQFVLK